MLLLAGLIYSPGFLSHCGPFVAQTTTRAIIQVESGGNPLAIGNNNLKKSFAPKTKDEATRLASSFIARGHSVDLGLMQINSLHLEPMKLPWTTFSIPAATCRPAPPSLPTFIAATRTGIRATLFNALSA
jgi:type IV secretion system protein VirB1